MDFYRIFASSYRLTNIFSSKNIKKILLFVLIGVILFLVFSNNVFASESVEILTFDGLSVSNGKVVSNSGVKLIGFYAQVNKIYHISHNNGDDRALYISTSVPQVGVDATQLTVLHNSQVYDMLGSDDYAYIFLPMGSTAELNVNYDYVNGMGGSVDNFVDTFSLSNLWEQLGFAVPLIGLAVLFALGFFIVRKVTKGESKAKLKF